MKRLAVTALWSYAFWGLGSLVAGLLGIPDLVGPVLGVGAGTLVWIDPRHVIWGRPTSPATTATAA